MMPKDQAGEGYDRYHMKSGYSVFWCIGILVLLFPASGRAQETVSLITYYPAPVAIYQELRVERMAVGRGYLSRTAHPWSTSANPLTHEIGRDADLVVENDLGIGTYQPQGRLHVVASDLTQAAVLLDDSSAHGNWQNRFAVSKNGTIMAEVGIAKTGNAGTSALDDFILDLPVSSQRDIIIFPSGNAGLGTASVHIHPDNSADGILDTNDVYLDSVDAWLSQLEPSMGGVYTLNASGSAVEVADAAILIGEAPISLEASGTYITWSPNPFTGAIFPFFTQHYTSPSGYGFGIVSHNKNTDKIWAQCGGCSCVGCLGSPSYCVPGVTRDGYFFAIGPR